MTEQHPVTPPPGLIDEWIEKFKGDHPIYVAIQAARWGADQELEACVALVNDWAQRLGYLHLELPRLRLARRPKPPSLKERIAAAITAGDEHTALSLLNEALPNG